MPPLPYPELQPGVVVLWRGRGLYVIQSRRDGLRASLTVIVRGLETPPLDLISNLAETEVVPGWELQRVIAPLPRHTDRARSFCRVVR